MGFIDKKTYSIKESARIITDETGIKHTKKDIYYVSNEGQLKICFNPQWGTSKHGAFCFVEPASQIERLRFQDKYFLAPKNRKKNFVRNVFNKNMSENVYPVLHDAGTYLLVNNFEKQFDVPLVRLIEAVNNEGETFKIFGCYEHHVLKELCAQAFPAWASGNSLPACKSDLGEDYNLYYYQCLNQQDEKQYLQPVHVDELYLTQFELNQYINKNKVPEKKIESTNHQTLHIRSLETVAA